MLKMLLLMLSLAVATASLVPGSALAQTSTQPALIPQMLASLTAPAPFSSELLTSSSTSAALSAEPAAVLPPVSTQFEAVFAVPCYSAASNSHGPSADAGSPDGSREPCMQYPSPSNSYARFLDSLASAPLTPSEKGFLALRNFDDPGNLGTITNAAAFTIATNSHTAFGPGAKGFGKDIGYSLAQDATGEFFGTFLIPSLAHQDPHYHRMPNASIPRRIFHAISRTVLAQSDSGRPMLNLSTLLTYPISAEFANLYVPGIHGNAPSTAQRILTGYATDPIDNLITEFLPDVARRIRVHVIFAQRILNQATGNQIAGDPIALP